MRSMTSPILSMMYQRCVAKREHPRSYQHRMPEPSEEPLTEEFAAAFWSPSRMAKLSTRPTRSAYIKSRSSHGITIQLTTDSTCRRGHVQRNRSNRTKRPAELVKLSHQPPSTEASSIESSAVSTRILLLYITVSAAFSLWSAGKLIRYERCG
jgi:hypothetical protein